MLNFAVIASILFVFSCGSKTNLNQMWGKDPESVDSLLLEAQIAYDRKEFDRSEELASKVVAINPKIGDASVILGYTYLAKAGLHPLTIAKKMAKQNKTDPNDPDLVRCPKPATSSATDTMKDLACRLLNMTDADYAALGTAKSVGNGTGLFAGKKIFVPATVSDEMRAKIAALSYANKGIKSICGFVSRDVLSTKDSRHKSTDCTAVEGGTISATKAHFLFAILHLVEALVYQTSLLSDSVGNTGTTSLQSLSDSLKTADFTSNIAGFAVAVTDLKTSVETVFAVDDQNSQISYLISDLKTINKSFAQIPGIPKNVTKKLSEGITEIEGIAAKLGGENGESKALKAQMNKALAKVLGAKIDDAIAAAAASGTPISAADKASVCSSYDSIAAGLPSDSGVTKPTNCP